MLEKQILVKVLKEIKGSYSDGPWPTSQPNDSYLDSLQEIGLINKGWDISLTSLGLQVLNCLDNERW